MPSRIGGIHARVSSPTGASTLITSAPRSASSMVAYGPASTREKSATRSPERGPVGRSATVRPLLSYGQVSARVNKRDGKRVKILTALRDGSRVTAKRTLVREGPMTDSIVFRGGTVLTMDDSHTIHTGGDVLVVG